MRGMQHHFCYIPAKGTSPEPKYEETYGKPKSRDCLLNNWPSIFESIVKSWNLEKTEQQPQTEGD